MTETLNLYQKNWRRLKIIENEKLISSLGFELTPIDLEAHYKINSFISSAVKSYKQQELLYMHDISSSYCSMTWWDEVKSILKKNVQGDKLALLFWNRLTAVSYTHLDVYKRQQEGLAKNRLHADVLGLARNC